ncbi:MAG: PfaD family polyunsaturated fatty acid/polyketide biosynthesis protein [Chitinophagales bacterium]
MQHKIAIIGISGLFPGSKNMEELWENLINKKDVTTTATETDFGADTKHFYHPEKGKVDKCYSLKGGFIRDFEFAAEEYDLKEGLLGRLDDIHKWSLYVAKEALKDSGYWQSEKALKDCGLILGNLSFPTRKSHDHLSHFYTDTLEKGLQELVNGETVGKVENRCQSSGDCKLDATTASSPASIVADVLGLQQAYFALDAACASSLYAIKFACDYLQTGKANMMLAGAVSCADPLFIHMGFSIFRAYSKEGDKFAPLDKDSGGLISSEGAGMLVLKRYEDAVRDGDRIHALISGVGLSNDGKGKFLLSPNPRGQLLALERAYQNSEVNPHQIEYLECHATGTPLGDKTEVNTIDSFWGDSKGKDVPLLGSVKSNMGHLLTAAGMSGIIKVILAMHKGIVPASIHLEESLVSQNGLVDKSKIVTEHLLKEVDFAGVNSFGFGGTNGHIVLERCDEHRGTEARNTLDAKNKRRDGEMERNFEQELLDGKEQKNSENFGNGFTPCQQLNGEQEKESTQLLPKFSTVGKVSPKPLAIVGMEAHFGSCRNLEEFWQTIASGKKDFGELPKKRWKGFEDNQELLEAYGLEGAKPPMGAYIEDFEIDLLRFRIQPREAEKLEPQQTLMLKVADNALKDAGFDEKALESNNVAVIVAMETELAIHQYLARWDLDWQIPSLLQNSDLEFSEEEQAKLEELTKNAIRRSSQEDNSASQHTSFIGNIMASRISALWDFNGPTFTLSAGENSTFRALEIAQTMLASGEIDAVVIGAVDLAGGLESVLLRNQLMPEGWKVGEGAGAVVLKRLEDSENDRVYGTVDGLRWNEHGGTEAQRGFEQELIGGKELAALDVKNEHGGTEAQRNLGILDARIERRDGEVERFFGGVDLVEVSGDVYAQLLPKLEIVGKVSHGSVSGSIGHTFAAAGMASLIKTALCVYYRVIPSALGVSSNGFLQNKSDGTDKNDIDNVLAKPWVLVEGQVDRKALIRSFGVDGTLAEVLLGEGTKKGVERSHSYLQQQPMVLLPIAGNGLEAILTQLERIEGKLKGGEKLSDVSSDCFDVYQENIEGKYCLSLVGDSAKKLLRDIGYVFKTLKRAFDNGATWRTPNGSYFVGKPLGKDAEVTFVYPGSSNAYQGLGQELFSLFPNLYDWFEGQVPNVESMLFSKRLYGGRETVDGGTLDAKSEHGGTEARRELDTLDAKIEHGGTEARRELDTLDAKSEHGGTEARRELDTLDAKIERRDGEMERDFEQNENFGKVSPLDAIGAMAVGVSFSAIYTHILQEYFGVKPKKVMGYSMGETSTMWYAMGVWKADKVMEYVHDSPIFQRRLSGKMETLAEHWGMPWEEAKKEWTTLVLMTSLAHLEAHIGGYDRVYLSFVNTSSEVIVSGDRTQCKALAEVLGCTSVEIDLNNIAHHDFVRKDWDGLVKMHSLKVYPMEGVDFYSATTAGVLPFDERVISETAARTCCEPVDFPRLMHKIYGDGARVFIELGASATCTRWIQENLEGKEHIAVSINYKGKSEMRNILGVLATLVSHRIPVDLSVLTADDGRETTDGAVKVGLKKKKKRQLLQRITLGGDRIFDMLVTEENREFFGVEKYVNQKVKIAFPKKEKLREEDVVFTEINNSTATPIRSPRINSWATNGETVNKEAGVATLKVEDSAGITTNLTINQQTNKMANQNGHQNLVVEQTTNFNGNGNGHSNGNHHKNGNGSLEDAEQNQDSHKERMGENGLILQDYSDPKRLEGRNVIWDEKDLREFAYGKISNVYGEEYAIIDTYKKRVMMPMDPYLLVSRITDVKAKLGEYKPSTMQTEYDIPYNAWYTTDGQIPWAVAVESGQCDLMLISYIGIDLQNKGELMYRLLDCTLTFLDDLPLEGQTLRYDISINSYAKSGRNLLFFFSYRCYVEDRMVLKMDGGCAGFFSHEDLAVGHGVVYKPEQIAAKKNAQKQEFIPLLDCPKTEFSKEELTALVNGDMVACFGDESYFADGRNGSLRLPPAKILMLDRITKLDRTGGAYGLGYIEAVKDLNPNDWYFPCHFRDDEVMAGSLQAEGGGQLLRFFMLYLGLQRVTKDARFQPIVDLPQKVICRKEITNDQRKLIYRMEVKEIGLLPEPYVVSDLEILTEDGTIAVLFENLGLRIAEKTAPWYKREKSDSFNGVAVKKVSKPVLMDESHVTEFALGSIEKAFGAKEFAVYNGKRTSRQPNTDLQVISRVLEIRGERQNFKNNPTIVAEYDVPVDAWYFEQNAAPVMPYSVLMEVALQPCGLLAAWMGSTLQFSDRELFFRNLDGDGEMGEMPDLRGKTITNVCVLTSSVALAGTVLNRFTFEVSADGVVFYKGKAAFGFFPAEALKNQAGLDNGKQVPTWWQEKGMDLDLIDLKRETGIEKYYSRKAAMPHYRLSGNQLNLLDAFGVVKDGGKYGKGYVYGTRVVKAYEWFFYCHFYQDPVMPGSLGVEAILQAMQAYALESGLGSDFVNPRFTQVDAHKTTWKYRGQFLRYEDDLRLEVNVKTVDGGQKTVDGETRRTLNIVGDASVWKGGLRIYEVTDLGICVEEGSLQPLPKLEIVGKVSVQDQGSENFGNGSQPCQQLSGLAINQVEINTILKNLELPVFLLENKEGQKAATNDLETASMATQQGWKLLACQGASTPEMLGDADFREFHGVKYAYKTGAMANGIASAELVIAMGKAGLMGSFGAAGLVPERVEAAIQQIQAELPNGAYCFNLIHSPNEPRLEEESVNLFLKHGVHTVEASAFLGLTPHIVYYRVAGLKEAADGSVEMGNRVIAKVSRHEVAEKFLRPAPKRILDALVKAGKISAHQAELAARVPMADDVTVEADSGGHTDNRPLVALLPAIIRLRDAIQAELGYTRKVRIGAGGGIGTPEAALATFQMGAAYIVTGSVNQACVESGSSDYVRKVLAEASQTDVMMAPAADMFEMGVELQVLKKGTLFPIRAKKLYELYRQYDSIEAIPLEERVKLEKTVFRRSLEDVWQGTVDFFMERDPLQIERANNNPKRKMALIFRWYLGLSSRWANVGEAGRQMDYQIWCGPSMGAFNDWVKGTDLEEVENRKVAVVAERIMREAAWLNRMGALGLDLDF